MDNAWIGYVILGFAIGFGWGVLAKDAISRYNQTRAKEGRILIDAPMTPDQLYRLAEIIQAASWVTRANDDAK